MKKILPLIALVSVIAFAGCQEIARSAAERPYRKAMKDGRMSPGEFQKQQDEIRRASEAKK